MQLSKYNLASAAHESLSQQLVCLNSAEARIANGDNSNYVDKSASSKQLQLFSPRVQLRYGIVRD